MGGSDGWSWLAWGTVWVGRGQPSLTTLCAVPTPVLLWHGWLHQLDMHSQLTDVLAASCPPRSDIVGFRAPFLETDETVRKVLGDNGFLYDRCAVPFSAADVLSRPSCHAAQRVVGATLNRQAPRILHSSPPPSISEHMACHSPLRVCPAVPHSSRHAPPYRSTLIEETTGASVSTGLADRVWPFDLADGSPINCE